MKIPARGQNATNTLGARGCWIAAGLVDRWSQIRAAPIPTTSLRLDGWGAVVAIRGMRAHMIQSRCEATKSVVPRTTQQGLEAIGNCLEGSKGESRVRNSQHWNP
jgi:hypothetical protein